MTDVQRLLDEATPLPWKPFADMHHEVEGRVGCVATAPDGAKAVCYGTNGTDAALIVHAVNSLPAYEAIVELAERYHSGHSVAGAPCRCDLCRDLRKAVDSLREKAPA